MSSNDDKYNIINKQTGAVVKTTPPKLTAWKAGDLAKQLNDFQRTDKYIIKQIKQEGNV
jgi:ribosome recycling factor